MEERNKPRPENTLGTAPINFSKTVDYSVIKGKTAFVLDGGHGLGLGIATSLAEHGARVALGGTTDEIGGAAAEALRQKGCDAKFFKTDTVDWDSQLNSFKGVLEWSGNQLDIVVASPGIVTNNLMLNILPKHTKDGEDPPKPVMRTIEVTLNGVYYTTSLALFYFNKLYADKRDASFQPQLVFICSMAGYDGLNFGSDYAAAKHGVRAIFKTVRKPRPSMARYQANMLVPTYVQTRSIEKQNEKVRDHNAEKHEIMDVVAGALRCICDPEVSGRAMCCCQDAQGEPGSSNFDLYDDVADGNGGRELLKNVDNIWLPSSTALSEDSNCGVQ